MILISSIETENQLSYCGSTLVRDQKWNIVAGDC